jgi:hypothetical protein
MIVTHDDDYLRMAAQDAHHAGIAYCSPGKRTLRQLIHRLSVLYNDETPERMIGRIVYL